MKSAQALFKAVAERVYGPVEPPLIELDTVRVDGSPPRDDADIIVDGPPEEHLIRQVENLGPVDLGDFPDGYYSASEEEGDCSYHSGAVDSDEDLDSDMESVAEPAIIEQLMAAWSAIKSFTMYQPLPPELRARVEAGHIADLWRFLRRRRRSVLWAYINHTCHSVVGGFFGLMRVSRWLVYDVWGNNELVFSDHPMGGRVSIVGTEIAECGDILSFHERLDICKVSLRNVSLDYLPQLAHHLQAYALFRKRDYNTLMMLKSKALAWGKDKHMSDSDLQTVIAGSVMVGFLPTVAERDSATMLNMYRPARLVGASNRWPNDAPRYPTRTWRDWLYSWTEIFTRPTNLTA
jgi:hypothetical protein